MSVKTRYIKKWKNWIHDRKAIELVLAVVVITLVVVPLTKQVDYSGAWDGDPSLHNHLAMNAVNVIVEEYSKNDGDLLRGFLQCYFRYPKMLHEIMLTCFILLVNGIENVDFAKVEFLSAWFVTIFTLLGIFVIYLFLRKFQSRIIVLAILPIIGLNGYILLYANFPRQNMIAHVFCWIGLLIYIHYRIKSTKLPLGSAIFLGVLFGASVSIHYSSTYLFFGILASEIFLSLYDKDFLPMVLNMIVIFSVATSIWFFIDLYYYIYTFRYPGEFNLTMDKMDWAYKKPQFTPLIVKNNYTFLSGMCWTFKRLSSHAMEWKITWTWWFFFGFLYRSFGVIGSLLIGIGAFTLFIQNFKVSLRRDPIKKRAIVIILVLTSFMVIISFQFFQNARKLMPFYPALCVLLLFGFYQVIKLIISIANRYGFIKTKDNAKLFNDNPNFFTERPIIPLTIIAGSIILLAQFFSYYTSASQIFHFRRDAGYMREYLKSHNINKILVLSVYKDSQMAPIQTNIREITLEEADNYEFIVLHRLYHKRHKNLMEKIKSISGIMPPIVSFKNQVALPLFFYEFPLTKEVMDPADSLIHNRSLYRWKDVRPWLQVYLKDYKRL